MDHTTRERLGTTELTEDNLIGATIYGPDDYEIGDVSHVHGSGPRAEVVVDVGGFLGIGAKPVALLVSHLDFMRGVNGDVHAITSLTKDEVKALPEHRDQSKDHTYIRSAGRKEMDAPPKTWMKTDEEIDESFPASDPPGNY
jgi:hypothetical protein